MGNDSVKQDRKPIHINLDTADKTFADEVAAERGGEGVWHCFACSTCVAGCPVRRVSSLYNPRRIIRLILTGQRDAVLKGDFIWFCSSCYTCDERCPQGVHIPSVMTALRNIAAREGHAPTGYEKQKDAVLAFGRLYAIDDFDNRKRAKAGLPEIITDNTLVKTLAASLAKERKASSGEPP